MHCTVLFTRYVCPGPVDELAEMLAVCTLISLNPTTYEEVSNRWKSSRCLRSRKSEVDYCGRCMAREVGIAGTGTGTGTGM